MYHVYVLKSEIEDRIYIGVSDDPIRRLKENNAGKTKSTKPYIPFKIVYLEEHLDKTSALKRERQIKKSGKIRNEIKNGTYHGPIV